MLALSCKMKCQNVSIQREAKHAFSTDCINTHFQARLLSTRKGVIPARDGGRTPVSCSLSPAVRMMLSPKEGWRSEHEHEL